MLLAPGSGALKTTDVSCWSVSFNKSLTCHNTEHQQSCEARHVGDVGQFAEWRVKLLVPSPCAKFLLCSSHFMKL